MLEHGSEQSAQVATPAREQQQAAAAAPRPPPSRALSASLVVAGIGAAAAALLGVFVLTSRHHEAQAHEGEVRRAAVALGPFVRVARVNISPANRVVTLPAEVRAAQRTQLFAKVSGYLVKVLVDKGDKVRRGQLLAELESPETDQQERAAVADLELKRTTLDRVERLLPGGAVSQSDVDVARAQLKVAQAALDRARASRDYEKIRAPFDGTVIARTADPGALLPAATSSTTSAQPLLELASAGTVRVALQLAQEEAQLVHQGDQVTIEAPGGTITARVTRLAHALDLRTRTMLVEIDIVRPPENLYPGAFVQVSLPLRGAPRPLVPAEALVTRGGALLVPTVENDTVHLAQVRTGVDDGRNVEILSGLKGGELVALNLGTDAVEGARVQLVKEPEKK
jgi:RND family efflux transporter MFP subunit